MDEDFESVSAPQIFVTNLFLFLTTGLILPITAGLAIMYYIVLAYYYLKGKLFHGNEKTNSKND